MKFEFTFVIALKPNYQSLIGLVLISIILVDFICLTIFPRFAEMNPELRKVSELQSYAYCCFTWSQAWSKPLKFCTGSRLGQMAWYILGMHHFKPVWIHLLLFGRISIWNRTHLFDYEADVLFKLYFDVCSIDLFGDECWFYTYLRIQSKKEERMQSCKNLIWNYHRCWWQVGVDDLMSETIVGARR